MQSLREKIEEILTKEHYTFAQLAEYLHLTEDQLANGLDHKTLELRYLEEISKNLKVPLYSFFRGNEPAFGEYEQPHYTNRLWENGQAKSEETLQDEIRLLKQAIARREAELAKSKPRTE